MGKITFMGAGSTVFAKNVLGDCMLTPALRDFELSLYDIDAERLEESYIMIDALNKNINEGRAKITKHLGIPNRKEALRGANFVVDAIQVGGYEPCTVTDFEIPKKYGLRQTIADTLGIGQDRAAGDGHIAGAAIDGTGRCGNGCIATTDVNTGFCPDSRIITGGADHLQGTTLDQHGGLGIDHVTAVADSFHITGIQRHATGGIDGAGFI